MEPSLQMKLFFSFLISLCLVTQLSLATPVQLCDETAKYDIMVKGVEISPSPIVRGHPTNMTFNLIIGKPIISGRLVVDISYFGWHIYSDSHDICVETSCPYSFGDFALAPLRTPLAFFFPGSYHMQIMIVDGDDDKLTCFGFDYELLATVEILTGGREECKAGERKRDLFSLQKKKKQIASKILMMRISIRIRRETPLSKAIGIQKCNVKEMKGRLMKKMKVFPSISSIKQGLSLLSDPIENTCSQICETPPVFQEQIGKSSNFRVPLPVIECSFMSQHVKDLKDGECELGISVSNRNHPDRFVKSEETLAAKHNSEPLCLSEIIAMEPNGGLQVEVDNHREHPSSLLDFEERCPPGGSESVIFYSTSLRGIRKTFEECNRVRFLLESFKVSFFERDVSMHLEFREELWEVLGGRVIPPRIFIKGRYIGGADEVVGLHEQGTLRKLLEGIPLDLANSPCSCCANTRFLVCPSCNGSCKVLKYDDNDNANDNDDVLYIRCPDCNENGLAKCPICC